MPQKYFTMKTTIQICGTASGVGKSVIVSGLCRIFLQDGFRVCPFKAQNMSLNSFVTKEGLEMGRAQVTQAQSCRIMPHTDMNPILIKPTTDIGAQVILQGKSIGNKTAKQYQNKDSKDKLFKKVKESFDRLSKEYDIVVIEGAGSPAEVNLRNHDIVNMKMAEYAKAPVILTGDIDKGGIFASLVGTLELLNKKERNMVKGFIINKFRGDKLLLKEGINFLEKKTRKPVLGVIPYFKDIRIPEEDSVVLEGRNRELKGYSRESEIINIAVVRLPHISNFTDFDPLEREQDVRLSYVSDVSQLNTPDVIIIPGTKNTIRDLRWLKESGFANKILFVINRKLSTVLIGICGGYQMLGKKIYDPYGIESKRKEIDGLGILPISTFFEEEKILNQVKAKEIRSGLSVFGYEIHHGRSRKLKDYNHVFKITERRGRTVEDFDGAFGNEKNIWGTYIHGIFDADIFRREFLNRLRLKKGLLPLPQTVNFNPDKEFDKLARLVRENINMDLLYRILSHGA